MKKIILLSMLSLCALYGATTFAADEAFGGDGCGYIKVNGVLRDTCTGEAQAACINVRIYGDDDAKSMKAVATGGCGNNVVYFRACPNCAYQSGPVTISVPLGGKITLHTLGGGESSADYIDSFSSVGRNQEISCEEDGWDWFGSGVDCSISGDAYVNRSDEIYYWVFRDDGKLQFKKDEWGGNWTPWDYDDGACLDYEGGGVYADNDCATTTHRFKLHPDGRLQMTRDEWGDDWNPWGLSGGACFTYLGGGEFDVIACNDDDGDWFLNDRQQLQYVNNPWGLRGGACYIYVGSSEFDLEDCLPE